MKDLDYKSAYERQKKAREHAENLLENKSRELYEKNESLAAAYDQLKKQNAQLLHQEKLASIGQLSAGVAHEINNPIGFVKSNISTLADYIKSIKKALQVYDGIVDTLLIDGKLPDKSTIDNLCLVKDSSDLEFILSDIEVLIDESYNGALRVQEIVKSLKIFARNDEGDNTLFDLNDCIETTMKLISNEIKCRCEVELILAELPPMLGSPGAINQVVLNLLVNASQAIEGKGKITIETFSEGEHIFFSVSDTGTGIADDVLPNIFDPFFTTKEVDVGTGLGLSITHGIVSSHQGVIEVDSQPGVGTRFSMVFKVDSEFNTSL